MNKREPLLNSQEQLQDGPKHPLLKYKRGSIDNAAFDQRFQDQVIKDNA